LFFAAVSAAHGEVCLVGLKPDICFDTAGCIIGRVKTFPEMTDSVEWNIKHFLTHELARSTYTVLKIVVLCLFRVLAA